MYRNKKIKYLIILSLITVCSFLNYGCISWTNPTPDEIEHKEISYDEYGNQTAGVIDICLDKKSFIVTQHFVDRYNALIDVYGKDFYPALKRNDGIEKIEDDSKYKEFYMIDKVHYYYMAIMVAEKNKNITILNKKRQ